MTPLRAGYINARVALIPILCLEACDWKAKYAIASAIPKEWNAK